MGAGKRSGVQSKGNGRIPRPKGKPGGGTKVLTNPQKRIPREERSEDSSQGGVGGKEDLKLLRAGKCSEKGNNGERKKIHEGVIFRNLEEKSS